MAGFRWTTMRAILGGFLAVAPLPFMISLRRWAPAVVCGCALALSVLVISTIGVEIVGHPRLTRAVVGSLTLIYAAVVAVAAFSWLNR
jgi:hypothetical protein